MPRITIMMIRGKLFPMRGLQEDMRRRGVRFLISCLIPACGCLLLPMTVLAAEKSGGGGTLLLIGKIFNVGLVILLLVWMGRKPLADFFASRTQSIREQLEEAQKAQQDAEAQLARLQDRMRNLDQELGQIKEAAEREARAESLRLIAEAERDAEKIIARARQEIEGMTRAARLELKAHVSELSVQLAEQKIREDINEEDRGRLFGRFVRQLGGKG
jgi:F-type H+-transporting ATPase subunit b